MNEEALSSLKVTIKMNGAKNLGNSSSTSDNLNDVGEESDSMSNSHVPANVTTSCPDRTELSPAKDFKNQSNGDEENPSSENSQHQLVLYDPAADSVIGDEIVIDPEPIQSSPHPFSNQAPHRVLPAIGTYACQCASCFKWRIIPTKEKYEEIREHIMEQYFYCEHAREWRPEISCEDPPDIEQDESRLWAIDKPSIAQPPPGWQRLMRIRAAGGSKFADVYYIAPTGKTLRSMLEIQRFLDAHPRYIEEGVSLLNFSFQTPKPLQENYLKKRPRRSAPPNYPYDYTNRHFDASQVPQIEWVPSPDLGMDLRLNYPPDYGLYPEINHQTREGNHYNHNW